MGDREDIGMLPISSMDRGSSSSAVMHKPVNTAMNFLDPS